MKSTIYTFSVLMLTLFSCSENSNDNNFTVAPATYTFDRNGSSTVDFNGQTTRIMMGNEFEASLKNTSETMTSLNSKFAHNAGENNFSEATLNASSKNMRSKTAASTDFFQSNTVDANTIKTQFDAWIGGQVNEVFPNWNVNASLGVAGQIQEAGGGPIRYINAKGLEYDQAIIKGLIGALMVDQILNNYLSTAVLDAGTNIDDNNAGILVEGKNYTTMEHKWDEAFGYVYGTDNVTAPALNKDSFLNKYLGRVEGDTDFAGIATTIYDAFKLGRAAIVAKDYMTRNSQIAILREKISEIIGIRVVYYLQQGKNNFNSDKGGAFHDLSEGFGFIYSLQFTRQPNAATPYFSKAEVEGFLNTLLVGNGFWEVSATTLDDMSNTIAAKFNFTVAQAGS